VFSMQRVAVAAMIVFALAVGARVIAQLQPCHAGALSSDATAPAGLAAADWSGIVAAHEAERHAVVAVQGGHRARNPGQQWVTSFDGRGFRTEPDAGGWSWGLQLLSYGFPGAERMLADRATAHAAGRRLSYARDAALQEWYVNDARGLEHGYTLAERPECAGAPGQPLRFVLAVHGTLRALVQPDGCGADFVNDAGATMLTYSGLVVRDAAGRRLPAYLQPSCEGLVLGVFDDGALYPLSIDPIAQQAYLKASNTGADDHFGYPVSVSGTTVVVGSWGEDSAATGVNGNQADNSAPQAGAAYVFVKSGSTWIQQAYLKASNAEAYDEFGLAAAISGDTIVVGAWRESSAATGVNGNQASNAAFGSGAAYVFVRSGTTWTQQAYLKASNAEQGIALAGDSFGFRVAVSGDTVIVGADNEDSSATGVNGNQSDNNGWDSGAAYVFVRNGTTWTQQAYLKASNTDKDDAFGVSVAIYGDTAIVGAVTEDSSATGANGNQADNSIADSGAAYVFVRSGTTWSQQAYLKASNPGIADYFGLAVALGDNTAVVGAFQEASAATGVNGNQADNSAPQAGAAYVFARSGNTWTQQAYLKASNTSSHDHFGGTVALSGNTVVVGAPMESGASTGVNGMQTTEGAPGSGSAYVFVRSGATWIQHSYLKASNSETFDTFGQSVSVSGGTVIVGSYSEASSAVGVNGDESNNASPESGAAYVFSLSAPQWIDMGFALAGHYGDPKLAGTGPLTAGSTGTLTLSNAAHSAPAILFTSVASTPVPFKGGTLVTVPPLLSITLTTSAAGGATFAWPAWPAGLPAGTSLYFQVAIKDTSAINGVSLSNALRAFTP